MWLKDKSKLKYVFVLILLLLLGAICTLPLFTKTERISTAGLINGDPDFVQKIAAPPDNRADFLSLSVIGNQQASLEILFKQPQDLFGIELYFPGDLSTQYSYGARSIEVYAGNTDNYALINRKETNFGPSYKLLLDRSILTKKIKLNFSDPFYKTETGGEVRISDFHLLKKERTSLIGLINPENTQAIAAYGIYYLIFLLVVIVPGYSFFCWLCALSNKKVRPDFMFILSPTFSIAIMFVSSALFLLTGLKLLLFLYLPVLIVLVVVFFTKGWYRDFIKNYHLLILVLVALFFIALTVGHRDYLFNLQYLGPYLDKLSFKPIDGYPGYFVDNLFPWRLARLYLNRYPFTSPESNLLLTQTTIYDRTPLLPMITSAVLAVFGESRFVFQRFLEVLSVLFLPAIFVLTDRYFSRKTALISMAFILLNVQIFFLAINVEIFYKYVSIYPIIVAIYVLFFGRNYKYILISLLLTLSFLIHPSTIIFSMAILVVLAIREKVSIKTIKNLFVIILPIAIALVLWMLIPTILRHYQIESDKSFYLQEAVKINSNLFKSKLYNLVALFLPMIYRIGFGAKERLSLGYFFDPSFLRYSITANLTLPVFVFLLYYLFRYFRKYWEFVSIPLLSLFIYWLLYLNQPDFFISYGAAYFILYPFVIPLLIAFVIHFLLRESLFIKLAVFIGYIIFALINFWNLSEYTNFVAGAPVSNLFVVITILSVSILVFVTLNSLIKDDND